jgi:trehalose/maltose hydrolase-like predicted phosphorylase
VQAGKQARHMAIMSGPRLLQDEDARGVAHGAEPDIADAARPESAGRAPPSRDAEHAVACAPIIPPAGHAALSPCADPGWLLCEEGLSPARQREIESLFAIGNGYIGVRASIGGVRFSNPATFIAGVFAGGKDLGPRLALLPQWLNVDVIVEDERLSPDAGRVLTHRLQLDLRQGVLWREWRHQDPTGRITRLTCFQLASLADRHVLLQSVMVTAENYAGTIGLATCLGPSGMAHPDVERVTAGCDATVMRVAGSEVHVAVASETRSPAGAPVRRESVSGGEERWSYRAALGQTVGFDRILGVFTSREAGHPAEAVRSHLASTCAGGFSAAVANHVGAWRRRWDRAGVRIAGDEQAQRALRFAVYHLIAAANPADEHVSVAARGLTGEAYRGRVFWDTEIFMLPFWVFTDPPAARAMLMYRYHTLDAGRRKAKAAGYEGALYAWESADTGDETAPRTVTVDGRVIEILTGVEEHHISADIAFAVWQYWRATGDDAFMAEAGTEILVETARFWASRVQSGPDGRAHIRRVIGPDEYHESVDDNAYTNGMAIFNLKRAADAAAWMEGSRPEDWRRLSARLGVDEKERRNWRAVAASIFTGFDPATNLFEQFAGYFQLEDIDPREWRNCGAPPDVCIGAERVRRSRIVKQADVVALSGLRWKKWPLAVHEANFRYYEPRTAHGSSLSPAVHALVAARLGKRDLALAYFHQAGEIDLANNMGNAAGGVHMAALGGLWQAAVFGMAGVQLREHGIAVLPHLPPSWTELAFPLQWRGRQLRLRFGTDPPDNRAVIEVAVETGDELAVEVPGGPACRIGAGQRKAVRGNGAGWGNWEDIRQ